MPLSPLFSRLRWRWENGSELRGSYLGSSCSPCLDCKRSTRNGTKDSQSYRLSRPASIFRPRTEGRARRVSLFFSLGIDSFYSLLKNHRDHPGDEKTIDHLLFVRGLDIAIDDPKVDDLFTMSVRNAKKVADQFGKTLVVASTNLRHFTNRFVSWGKTCHGAALASIALALSEGFTEVKIASTYDWEHLFPWGSHPQLDPLWSNGKVVLTHDGCEATRLDKTHLVSGIRLPWKRSGFATRIPIRSITVGSAKNV